jgi:hypothetical protein
MPRPMESAMKSAIRSYAEGHQFDNADHNLLDVYPVATRTGFSKPQANLFRSLFRFIHLKPWLKRLSRGFRSTGG